MWVVGMVAILLSLISHWALEKVEFKAPFYFGIGLGVLLLLADYQAHSWNEYITQSDAEPFYWLEGVSIWPSQLLRLSIVLFAWVFLWWGHMRIKKMQKELQAQEGNSNVCQTFSLPNGLPDALSKELPKLGYWDVLFIGH